MFSGYVLILLRFSLFLLEINWKLLPWSFSLLTIGIQKNNGKTDFLHVNYLPIHTGGGSVGGGD